MASEILSSDLNETADCFRIENRQARRVIAEIATPITDLAYRMDNSEFEIVPEKLADPMTHNISNLVATIINAVLDDISITDARIVPVYVINGDLHLVIRFMTGGDEEEWSPEVQDNLEIVFKHIAHSLIEEPGEVVEIDGQNITNLVVRDTSAFLKRNQNRKIKQPLRIRTDLRQADRGEGINIACNLRVVDYEARTFEFSGVAMVDGVIWSENRTKFIIENGNNKGKSMYLLFDPDRDNGPFEFLVNQLNPPGKRISFTAVETTARDGSKSIRLVSAEIQPSLLD